MVEKVNRKCLLCIDSTSNHVIFRDGFRYLTNTHLLTSNSGLLPCDEVPGTIRWTDLPDPANAAVVNSRMFIAIDNEKSLCRLLQASSHRYVEITTNQSSTAINHQVDSHGKLFKKVTEQFTITQFSHLVATLKSLPSSRKLIVAHAPRLIAGYLPSNYWNHLMLKINGF